jgi:PAS domain S-box-containing protein
LIILVVLFGAFYAIAIFSRVSKLLKDEVEAKTGELEESHERFLTVLDSLDAAVYVADMDTYQILFANKYLQKLFGDPVGKTCWQVLQASESGPCEFCNNEKLLTAEGEPTGVHAWEHFNPVSRLWFEIRDRAVRWEDGRTVRLEIAIDITERKKVENRLKESEAKFRIISEQSLLGIVMRQNGSIIHANHAFSKITEYSVAEILKWSSSYLDEVVCPQDIMTGVNYDLNNGDNGKQDKNYNLCHIVTKSGADRYAERYLKNVSFNGKKVAMATFIDVTDKKQAEEKAKIQQRQLIQADKFASIGVLSAGVAHEINNPNHSIMSHARVISDAFRNITPVLEEYYEEHGDFAMGGLPYTEMRREMPICLNGISYGARRIDSIVSDLKNFARQEGYELSADTNLNFVVKSAVALASNYISKATNNFRVQLAENIPKVLGNFQRLEQVMLNLIQNACQALRNRDEAIFIEVSHNSRTRCVEVSICDHGEGIPKDDLSRIKDPFFTTKREQGGTGLGLSISATIVEDHHGTMSFSSDPGGGTTVKIAIPEVQK